MAGQTPRQSARVRDMLHRASRDQGQGRVEIFSAHNSGQLVEVGRRFADIARTVAGGTAPGSPLNTTVSGNRRFTVASRPLADYRLVRVRYDCDVNDVVLWSPVRCATGCCCHAVSRRHPRRRRGAMVPMLVYPDIELDSTGPGQAIGEVSPFWRHSRRGRQHRGAAVADRACHRIALDRGQPRRRQDHRHVCWVSRHRCCTSWGFALRPASRRGCSSC